MRILQLSDPHLLADPAGCCRGRPSLVLLRHGLRRALGQLEVSGDPPDLLLITGDLCQDEGWGGYVRLRQLLEPFPWPVALLPGNHDHPQLMRAALGRRAVIAPALLRLGGWRLMLLDSHRPGSDAGRIGATQLGWVRRQLSSPSAADNSDPLLVAVHHPPTPIGDAAMDRIGLGDGEELMALLRQDPSLRAVLFGHVHQHWQGLFPGGGDASLLGCPSTLCGFGPVQPCPLGRPQDPGGRLLLLDDDGGLRQRLLRWALPDGSNLG